MSQARGWTVADVGDGWRRVVPSPRPLQILEMRAIELLASQGVTVVCTGGGGIPVVERHDGSLIGVEAVIDKDLASALLARQLHADHPILLTDVDGVYLGWGTNSAQLIRMAGLGALKADDFAPGSMGPKIEAAVGFAAETGRPASIGRLEDAAYILAAAPGSMSPCLVSCRGSLLRLTPDPVFEDRVPHETSTRMRRRRVAADATRIDRLRVLTSGAHGAWRVPGEQDGNLPQSGRRVILSRR
jgi:carbamate kinase